MRDPNQLNGEELAELQLLVNLHGHGINSGSRILGQRLKKHPGAWQKWRSGVALIGKALDELINDMTEKQRVVTHHLLKNGEINIKLKGVAGNDGELFTVPTDDFVKIVNRAMEGDCSICLKQAGEIRGCELRKAFEVCCPPNTYENRFGCPYRDLVITATKRGEYV